MSGVFLPLDPLPGVAVKVVATFHGVNNYLQTHPIRHRIHKWMAQRLMRYNARMTSVDRTNTEIAEKTFALPKDRFEVIPNGISSGAKMSCPYLRGSAEFLIGQVGTIMEIKGWRITAEAVLAVRATGRNVKLVIAGHGPDEAAARELSRKHPDTIICSGFVHHPQRHLLPELDLMAVMSVHEGLPMTIIEAMSTGLPVAATNAGGIPEAVIHGENGLIIERTAGRLADVIIELYDNPDLLAKMSRRAREIFSERFSIGRVILLYDHVYRNNSAQG
jgi:glycosyltransferase involved in cell wall biosynthesis